MKLFLIFGLLLSQLGYANVFLSAPELYCPKRMDSLEKMRMREDVPDTIVQRYKSDSKKCEREYLETKAEVEEAQRIREEQAKDKDRKDMVEWRKRHPDSEYNNP